MWLWRLVIHILFLSGGDMKTCRCADNMVNVNYERIASWDGTWFSTDDLWIWEKPFTTQQSGGQRANYSAMTHP